MLHGWAKPRPAPWSNTNPLWNQGTLSLPCQHKMVLRQATRLTTDRFTEILSLDLKLASGDHYTTSFSLLVVVVVVVLLILLLFLLSYLDNRKLIMTTSETDRWNCKHMVTKLVNSKPSTEARGTLQAQSLFWTADCIKGVQDNAYMYFRTILWKIVIPVKSRKKYTSI